MIGWIGAGLVWLVCVFALGVILGVIRVLVLVPAVGELIAVLCEMPLILGWSWAVCLWAVRRFQVPKAMGPRVTMALAGFAPLMALEAGIPLIAGGAMPASPPSWHPDLPTAIGLAGQIIFGLMPVLDLYRRSRTSG